MRFVQCGHAVSDDIDDLPELERKMLVHACVEMTYIMEVKGKIWRPVRLTAVITAGLFLFLCCIPGVVDDIRWSILTALLSTISIPFFVGAVVGMIVEKRAGGYLNSIANLLSKCSPETRFFIGQCVWGSSELCRAFKRADLEIPSP